MASYYVNDTAQPNGDHEVHVANCYWCTLITSKTYLGEHYYCSSAVQAAKSYYRQSNGCAHCSPACHTG